jgi:hypothetical protein
MIGTLDAEGLELLQKESWREWLQQHTKSTLKQDWDGLTFDAYQSFTFTALDTLELEITHSILLAGVVDERIPDRLPTVEAAMSAEAEMVRRGMLANATRH